MLPKRNSVRGGESRRYPATCHVAHPGDIDCRPESQQNDVMRLREVEVLCDDRTTEHDDCSDKQSHLPGTTEQLSVDGNLARQVRALSHQFRTHQLKGQRHRGRSEEHTSELQSPM